VTGLLSQGRGEGNEWVTAFLVSYSLDAYHWLYITDQYDNQRVSLHVNRQSRFHNRSLRNHRENDQCCLEILYAKQSVQYMLTRGLTTCILDMYLQ